MGTATLDISDISIGAGLTRQQAEAIFAQGQEAVVFALLELAKRLAEAQGKRHPSTTLSTPSDRGGAPSTSGVRKTLSLQARPVRSSGANTKRGRTRAGPSRCGMACS